MFFNGQYPVFTSLLVTTLLSIGAAASDYGDRVAALPSQMVKRLAEANSPNEVGAIGRNRPAYFHVRFQRGMHHVADYGLVSKRVDVIQRFLTAVTYSLDRQLPTGDFELVIPESLKDNGKPSIADRASGVAIFVSSLGLGIHALETNAWFMESSACANERRRLSKVKPRLKATLAYLLKHQQYLEEADSKAPNRLLFDALAFEVLGRILKNEAAQKVAKSFVDKAVNQVHKKEGYFIEGGGFDSSYNAVATALALRLVMVGYDGHELQPICMSAIHWQKDRVMDSGEVSTEGNTRVRPGKSGESFLGKEKDVDVGHVVEAFTLGGKVLSDRTFDTLAARVVYFYESKRSRSQ